MKEIRHFFFMFFLTGMVHICYASFGADQDTLTFFGKIAKEESSIPIRPGKPGEVPFWNTYTKRFIYAPAFNYPTMKGADRYRYEILCKADSTVYSFESEVPYTPLTSVWSQMPIGHFDIQVIGITKQGDIVGVAGKGSYYRAAYFNGPYHQPVLSYDSSGLVGLYHIMHLSYVNYWLEHKVPDPEYKLYRYPAKMFGSLISGAVMYAKLTPDKQEAERALKIATIVADYLLKISFPKGDTWEYFPPTYHGEWIEKLKQAPYIRLDNMMSVYGTETGNAYLDLYDFTDNKKYLKAAKRIANTFLKTQLEDGSWHLNVNPHTGEPTSTVGNIAVPTTIINFFDRLRKDYKMEGLDIASKKALGWIMENPVKTFNWHGQFEDVGTHEPYQNLSRKETCQLAAYLFKNKKDDPESISLAEELLRFSEDQFVIWEKPQLLNEDSKSPGKISTNWITPCVQEQSVYWMPTATAAILMVHVYWHAYTATHKPIYLAKAKSLANVMTIVQEMYQGHYSTYFSKYTLGEWLNCNIAEAKEMIFFGNNLKSLTKME